MGLRLRHPFMAGASPFSAHLDGVRRLEDAGASAIVLHSLFEEQITEAQSGRIHGMGSDDPAFIESLAAFPRAAEYPFAPDQHLEHLRRIKAAVHLPVIASLNGTSAEAWLKYAHLMQEAGADALEVNFYEVVTDFSMSALAIERDIVNAVVNLKHDLKIPVSIKLSPVFHGLREFCAPPRRGWRRRTRHLQPLLSAGHRYPDLDGRPVARAVTKHGAAASPAMACDSSRSHPSVARCHWRRRNVE